MIVIACCDLQNHCNCSSNCRVVAITCADCSIIAITCCGFHNHCTCSCSCKSHSCCNSMRRLWYHCDHLHDWKKIVLTFATRGNITITFMTHGIIVAPFSTLTIIMVTNATCGFITVTFPNLQDHHDCSYVSLKHCGCLHTSLNH